LHEVCDAKNTAAEAARVTAISLCPGDPVSARKVAKEIAATLRG